MEDRKNQTPESALQKPPSPASRQPAGPSVSKPAQSKIPSRPQAPKTAELSRTPVKTPRNPETGQPVIIRETEDPAKNINFKMGYFRVLGEEDSLKYALIAVSVAYIIFAGLTLGLFVLWMIGGWIYYQVLRKELLGNCIRVTEDQFPEVLKMTKEAARILGMQPPDVYLNSRASELDVFTVTLDRDTIIMNASFARIMDNDELKFLIAHELGHIKADHISWLKILNIIQNADTFAKFVTFPLLLGVYIMKIWTRKAELTADRIALAVVGGNIKIAISTLAKISAGEELAESVNADEFERQAYELKEDFFLLLNEFLASGVLLTRRIKKMREFLASEEWRWATSSGH